ncbi:Olfactory receptor 1038 [Heterocephalus glaber]|uniref:Olfactory receptor 1038 n=1 Tax=Heterocephalus glaber TaxID=10181 RepID=G5BKJ0_HETGA|nr:Olfactory receptor 1038 [Heterocephalus glaber]
MCSRDSALFLLVYGMTVMAKLGMILLIKVDPRLHMPMYYFLGNLSFCDVYYSSPVFPKMLADFLSKQKRIPYNLCAIQMYFFGAFVDVECLMLAVMVYDHYIAISNPLFYTIAMSRRVCTQLVACIYIVDLPLLALSCADTSINKIVMFTFIGCVMGCSVIIVLLSYSSSITIFKMNSAKGRHKAFSTYGSHLAAVAMFHNTLLFMFFQPSLSCSMEMDKMASVFYTVIIPYAQPPDLQLKEQGCEDCSETSNLHHMVLWVKSPFPYKMN